MITPDPPPAEECAIAPTAPEDLPGIDRTGWQSFQDLAQAIIASAPDGIVLVDGFNRIVLVNPAMEAICGYASAELLGQSVEIFLPPAVRERHRQNVRRYARSSWPRPMGMVENLSLLHKSGRAIPVDIALGQFQRDGATATVAFVRALPCSRSP